MTKILKFLMLGLASVLLLVVLIIGGIFLFVDPNDFKSDITSAVHDATGRDLTITGDISLSIFPWLGLSLGDTELSNAEGFGETPFARVNNVDIKVKLLPLLQQRLEMQKVRLHGLRAHLAKDKTGRSNWDDLAAPAEKPATPETPSVPPTPDSTTGEPKQAMGALAALAIEGLELENAHLEWNDQQTSQHIVIDKLTLRTGPLSLPAPVDVSLSMDVDMKQPEIKDHIEFTGQIIANPDKQSIELKQIQLSALGIALSGQVGIKELDKTPEASGHIQLADVSPRELAGKLGIQLPETSDAAALKKANANITFSANSNEANLTKLNLVLDDTELNGTASVKNFSAPAIRFNVDANSIDVDRYLPRPTDNSLTDKAMPPPTPGSAATAATQLPLEPLRSLDVNGNINLGNLKIAGAQLSDMKLGINGNNGQIRLHPVQASLYNGQYTGDIKLDVRTNTPKVTVNEKLSTINVGPLLKDVLDKEYVSGTANITAQLTATGTGLETIKQSLNGKASFSFKDGKVNGVNIGQKIREAYAKLKKKPAPPKTENTTDFAEMTGTITVANGIIRNNDLNAKSPLLRIKGEGKVNLPRERINYLVNAAIVESNEGQTGKELEELKSHIIPIKVTGKLTDPKFKLDLGPVLQKRIKKQVDKRIKKEKEKIKKRIEKDLKKKLEEDLKKKFGIRF